MKNQCFMGIDVGGTKISGAIVMRNGKILASDKQPTPQGAPGKKVVEVISSLIKNLLSISRISTDNIKGIGIGIPGIYDPINEKTLVSPNLNIDGFSFAGELRKRFKAPIVTGNDVNVGLLGEQWLGSAKEHKNAVGIFLGTGIGGALVVDGKLFTGTHGAASEIGHMVIDPNGIKCGCGNNGCLEALASRTAIEKNIRKEFKKGRKSIISKILRSKTSKLIKSGTLKKALKKNDKLTIEVLTKAAEYTGISCISLRHLLDPEIIVLGGGLIEACGDFMIPIIRRMMRDDAYYKPVPSCKIVEATLGDNAAILGAARLAQESLGFKLYKKPAYPSVKTAPAGKIKVNDDILHDDFYIRADGKIRKLDNKKVKPSKKASNIFDVKILRKIIKKDPEILIIGSNNRKPVKIAPAAERLLEETKIDLFIRPVSEAIKKYSSEKNKRKALLIRMVS